MIKNIETALPAQSVLQGEKYKYRIEKVLGQGSFGITYLAKVCLSGSLGDINSNVLVAIKEFFMRDINGRSGTSVITGSNSELYHNYRKDFIKEARNLSKLNHPHIVKVLEYFEQNGTAYYSMEYIDGGNLNEYIKAKDGLPEKEALEAIVQIAGALSCMHGSKMLHLDLKPMNIMRRKKGELVLIDFGLSKQYNIEGIPESSTRIGSGTFGYAPIEQNNYKKEDGFSPTLDIYALGATLFKLLTGVTPPDASTILNEGFPEDILYSKGICKDVISIVSRAMDPMKKRRPQTAEEFINGILPTIPIASSIKKNVSHENSFNEDTVLGINSSEICNGFHVNWSENVTAGRKNQIRALLQAMYKIGEKDQVDYTEYGPETFAVKPLLSLGIDTWRYLYPLLIGENTDGWFPPRTISNALEAIQLLALWTGLPFRLANENELVFDDTSVRSKTLVYSTAEKLQYQPFEQSGLNDINTFSELLEDEYEIQIVCEGYKSEHSVYLFDNPFTQEAVNEILPVGFGLYKVRKSNCWNIKSPLSRLSYYLPEDYDGIGNVNIIHVPGGGPRNGFDCLGTEAWKDGYTYFYKFEDGRFEFIEKLSLEQIEEREYWT